MRELAYIELDGQATEPQIDEDFERELEAAAAGDWDAAELDPPPDPLEEVAEQFTEPVSIEEFMDASQPADA